MACSADPSTGFVSAMANYVDCQSETLGSGAWQALAAPGSTLTVVLTGFLTVLIALTGYNLLVGRALTIRGATLAFIKLGAVLALATSWPAYRTLVYDVVTDGPQQLVAEIGPRAGVVGSDGTLLQRLDLADQALAQLAILGPGNALAAGTQVAPPPFGGFDAFALGGSRILFLLTAIASLGAVRLLAGLMLAFGPFFIAFLLFDSTRSMFEGWVRVLGGAALAAVGVAIALGLELALLEPWLSIVLARRMAGEALPALPSELFVIACLFSILVLATLYGCARLAHAFRLPPILPLVGVGGGPAVPGLAPAADVAARAARRDSERSRAAAVAGILAATSRREEIRAALLADGRSRMPGVAVTTFSGAPAGEDFRSATPVGRTFQRRSAARVSARAARRDSGA